MKNGILHFPTPNYNDIPAKVDCWLRNWKIGGENNKVSGAVTCGVVQMYARNVLGIS
jgi:hypothetical protein